VAVVAVAYFVGHTIHRTNAATASSSVVPPVNQPLGQPNEIAVSMQALTKLYRENTQYQADKLLEAYQGKLVTEAGLINNVSKNAIGEGGGGHGHG
jgi:hypothetical protein